MHTNNDASLADTGLAIAERSRPEAWAMPSQLNVSRLEKSIDFRKLRYFVQIVAEGSFSIAAQRLHIAQPALSHHVRELESMFGVSLLTRGAHGVEPTEAGRCLYENGIAILVRVREAVAEVSAFSVEANDYVTFGLQASLAAIVAAPLVRFIRLKAPNIQFRIVEGTSADIQDWLESGRLDVALLHDAPGTRRSIRQTLFSELLYLIAPRRAFDGAVGFGQVSALPLILPGPRHGLRDRLEREAEEAKMPLNISIEIDSVLTIKKLVEAGLGYSVLPASDVYVECEEGRLERFPIVDPVLRQTLCMHHSIARAPSKSAVRVRHLAIQLIDDLIRRSAWPDVFSMDTAAGQDGRIAAA